MNEDQPRHKTRQIGSLKITHTPGRQLLPRHVKLALAVGLVLTAFHDLIYRQTGGIDFEMWGYVSHAGSDLLALTFAIATVLFFIPERR